MKTKYLLTRSMDGATLGVSLELIAIIILSIWVVGLSVVFYILLNHYNRLAKVSNGNLKKVLDKILEGGNFNKSEVGKIWREMSKMKESEMFHLQRVGIVRFNPFNEIGGDHSFSLAVLDAVSSGFVITGIHTRERTRIYVKSIQKGISKQELSRDEKKALAQATK